MRPILFRLGKLRLPGLKGAPPLLHRLPPGSSPPAPFAQSDWPNPPRGPLRLSEPGTWTHNPLLDTLSLPPAAQPRAPLVTRYAPPRWQPPDVPPNLLSSTLGQVPAPFKQTDWPNPSGAKGAVTLGTWLEGYKVLLFQETIPSLQLDWPVPKGSTPAISQNTWLQNHTLDTLAPAPAPFAQVDWPVPRGAVGVIDLRTWLKDGAQRLFQESIPHLVTDWPNPRGPASALQAMALNLLVTTLASTQAPFNLTDWPNPRAAAPNADLRTLLVNLLETTLGVTTAPFNLTNWPNPLVPWWRGYLPTHYRTDLVSPAGPQPFVGLQDWPVPPGPARAIDLRTWLLNLLQGTLTPIIASPFYQTDWPNPRGAQRLATQDLVNLLSTLLAPQATPFAQLAWPNPLVPVGVIDLRTWLDNLLQTTMTVQPAGTPFAQTDWPNPRGPLDIIALRTLITLLQQSGGVTPDVLRRLLMGIGL